ncbi:unnamed protein product [Penicillium salamii]|uniref:NlpC/P60 domain-containing protein n=1 Tax=Penicillium salamii TaxID=1612424 RepID=A0A9W4JD30_9EURO|nr:unnamed protein product [Penicillium salamii]CAG8363224.1 unnamed protein product [Penicillium salamii]CAG8388647.1 unnamed protein product [Penicillium salamii]CAG8392290.1 unnamed protein product [Penicillium salamii]
MHITSLIAFSLTAAITAVSAYPITGDDVNCRSGPGTSYASVKTYKRGQDVKISCQTSGTDVFGNNIWDKTSDNCYVSDYYFKTGSSGYVTTKCGGGGGGSTGGGKDIIAAAETQKGLPYVWGGGGCKGPSGGGFDCSGLTQYAICKALKKTIPRVAQDQYNSGMGKRYPRSQAKPGDLLFWGTGGDCKNKVVHVGIFIKDGLMINAARTGTPVREQSIWTSYGGEKICPEVMRYVAVRGIDVGVLTGILVDSLELRFASACPSALKIDPLGTKFWFQASLFSWSTVCSWNKNAIETFVFMDVFAS